MPCGPPCPFYLKIASPSARPFAFPAPLRQLASTYTPKNGAIKNLYLPVGAGARYVGPCGAGNRTSGFAKRNDGHESRQAAFARGTSPPAPSPCGVGRLPSPACHSEARSAVESVPSPRRERRTDSSAAPLNDNFFVVGPRGTDRGVASARASNARPYNLREITRGYGRLREITRGYGRLREITGDKRRTRRLKGAGHAMGRGREVH